MNRTLAEPLECRILFDASDAVTALPAAAAAASVPPSAPFHLTSRPWQALNVSSTAYLDEIEQIARVLAKYQDASGKIIDPYAKEEIQYSTPYFAFAVGVLQSAGRASDLLSRGTLAMESATATFAKGVDFIPNGAGEFFIGPLTQALALYQTKVPAATMTTWRQRMSTPLSKVLRGDDHNWRTFAMVGEWNRVQAGLSDKAAATSFIESSWNDTQEWRFTDNSLNLYRDYSSDPDSLAVDAVARGNILMLLQSGYDGPSRDRMAALVDNGARSNLLMQDPTGQAPTSGRTSDHTWSDALDVLNDEIMARRSVAAGDAATAGRFRHASALSFKSLLRWQRSDGSYFVTKNRFDPALRVGYQAASYLTNYDGSIAYQLGQAYLLRKKGGSAADTIAEKGAPSEVGGFSFKTSSDFANAFADAGGTQIQVGLRGGLTVEKGQYWTELGIDRISRAGWDSRLGPGDGARDANSDLGVSFAPTFLSNGTWQRLASIPEKYTAAFATQFTSPTLVRATIDYTPGAAGDGPTFHQDLVLTPDGIFSTVTSSAAAGTFGVTWPILTNDGTTTLTNNFTSSTASAAFSASGDQLSYIAVGSGTSVNSSDATIRGAYGDLRPVRMTSSGSSNQTFVYPRNPTDPTTDTVRASIVKTSDGFTSVLGRVSGNMYVGRTSAGGSGAAVDFNFDGKIDATFSEACTFVMQRETSGKITKVEADRPVTLTMNGKSFALASYTSLTINQAAPPLPPSSTKGPIKKEFESLKPVAQSDSTVVKADAAASAGAYLRMDSTAAKDFVTFGLSGLSPGSYKVLLGVRTSSSSGILQVQQSATLAGPYANLGVARDQYTAGSVFSTIDLGTVTVDSSGALYFKMNVTGKNAASTGFKLSLDSLTLTPA